MRTRLEEKYPGVAKSSGLPFANTFLSTFRVFISVGHSSKALPVPQVAKGNTLKSESGIEPPVPSSCNCEKPVTLKMGFAS